MVNIYDANDTIFTVSKGTILLGFRNPVLNIYRIPLVDMVWNNNTNTIIVNRPPTEFLPDQPPPNEAVHNVYKLKTQPELVWYHHASAGFPNKPTWLAAIKNKHFASWPGLTLAAARKHFPNSEETHKGHGRKTPSGLRSNKDKPVPCLDNNNEAFRNKQDAPFPLRPVQKEQTIFYCILHLEDAATQKIWTNQTGKFPKKSRKGNQYIMVLTESDSDVILVEAMKNQSSGEMIRAFQKLIDHLHAAEIAPKHHILDNECSDEFKDTIKSNNMTYQLAPPHNHRCNHAKKAIQTFKDHFVAILCRTDKEFPLCLWDLLLPHAKNTLNMLCPSRMTPTVSAYTYLWRQHDYSLNPFVPLGCKVEANLVPTSIRETWAPHTTSGFYVGNSWEHYCCHEVFTTDTSHTQMCSTLFFKHKYLTMPTITTSNALIRAADNLTDAIAGIIPPPNITTNAIDQLINIFKLQATKNKDAASAQRMLKEWAQTARVSNKTNKQSPTTEPTTTTTTTPMSFPPLELEYPDLNTGMLRGTPMISQDKIGDNSSPAANTCLQRKVRTVTQDYLFHLMDTPELP